MRTLLLLLALSLGWGLPARADEPTVVPLRAGTAQGAARCDLGSIPSAGIAPIVHTFLLRNGGTVPLTISRFQPSCHCTTAVFVPDRALPVTLAPGAEAAVCVRITVEPLLTGPLEKSVQVYALGADAPVATLTLAADLRPLVSLEPRRLDFGAVHAGHAQSRTLTAEIDSRFVPLGEVPRIVATDPDLKVTSLATSPGPNSDTRVYTYRVTLASDASLGSVRDMLQFTPSPGAPTVLGVTLADAAGVPVSGSVLGSVTASPSALAFGTVSLGQTPSRRVILTVRGNDALPTAHMTAEGRALGCYWGRGTARRHFLIVTLAAAELGSFTSQVTITLANGQRLRLPVTAYVSTP